MILTPQSNAPDASQPCERLPLDEWEQQMHLPPRLLGQAAAQLVTSRKAEPQPGEDHQPCVSDCAQPPSDIVHPSAIVTQTLSPFSRRIPLRERIWAAVRMSASTFTAGDIAQLAGQGEADLERETHRYLRALFQAGYLRRLHRAPHSGPKEIRYALLRNTGPSAPIFSRTNGTLRDPNTGEIIPCQL